MWIGLDIGSSSVKAVVTDRRGRVRAKARRPIGTHRASGGRVEHDGAEVVRASIEVLTATARAAGRSDDGWPLGIATQRSTVLFWDRDTGRALTPAYSWQDLRGAALCARLDPGSRAGPRRGRKSDPSYLEHTGLRLSPHYSASKLAWALRNVRGLRRRVAEGRALWGTLGTYLVWRLGGGSWYAVDHANAQRTLLFDLRDMSWDPELFSRFGIESLLDAPALPALVPTKIATPITLSVGRSSLHLEAMTGDQQAALTGLGCRRAGDVAINYGSGAFVLKNVGGHPVGAPGLLTTLIDSSRNETTREPRAPEYRASYALEGPVNAAATAIDWARRRLKLRVRTIDLDRYLGRDDGRTRTVHFLPAISGLGAPRWDPSARPRFVGDLRGADPRSLMRTVVEAIALRCAEIVRAATTGGRDGPGNTCAPILVSGGLTRCRSLLQAQADLLQRPLIVLGTPDATGVGAAILAGSSPGHFEKERRKPGNAESRLRMSAGRGASEGTGEGARIVRPAISRDSAEARFRAWERAVYRPGAGRSFK